MYRIAILQEDKDFARQLEQDCLGIMRGMQAPCRLNVFEESAVLLQAVTTAGGGFDLLLLDTVLNGESVLPLARQLRQAGCKTPLVFIAENGDMARESYEVQARHYLLKLGYRQPLSELLNEDYHRWRCGGTYVFGNGSVQNQAKLGEITYMEIRGRKVAVHLPQREFLHDGKLSDLLAKLPGCSFVRCHQGYAVNLVHVQQLAHRELLLDTGLSLPVSRTYYKEMRQAFNEWYKCK